jgi:hypothetical protein
MVKNFIIELLSVFSVLHMRAIENVVLNKIPRKSPANALSRLTKRRSQASMDAD